MATPILFKPVRVQQLLDQLPTLAASLTPPAEEGDPSKSLPEVLRTTRRELYRWIANTHYEHLVGPILELEQVLASGCRFDRLLRTTDREQFISATAEVFVAHDFIRRGYTVETIATSNQASPDLRVTGRDVDLAVEVYSPRELAAVDAWMLEVGDLLQYVDVATSFQSRIETTLERTIPPQPWQYDPWAPDKMLAATHEDVIAQITRDVEAAARRLERLDKTYVHHGTPMRTTIELHDVRQAHPDGPRREGSFSLPGFSGYSPAGVFKTIVERALKKAKRRQTHGLPVSTRALVVYLMGTKIATDLVHPAHLSEAEAILDNVEPSAYGLDVITFVARALPTGLGMILAVADDANLNPEQIETLFK